MSEYAAKQVKKLMEEAINRPGMRAGLPKAKIPVDLLNSILKDRESLASENTRLRALLQVVAEEDLDADAADGVTVLQVVIKEARDLLAIKEKID